MKALAGMPDIRLVLADVDGTLVTKEKILTERAAQAVHQLEARKIRFAITSGRPPRGMAMLIEPLALQTPIAGFNGGVYTGPDLKVFDSRSIPAEVAPKVVDLIRQQGLVAWLYTATDWFVPDLQGAHVDREAWTVKFAPKLLEDFSPQIGSAVKIVGVSDDLELVAKAEAACQKEFPGAVSAQRSQPYYLDVTNVEANKGSVVDYLAKYYQITPHQIATLGDMPNDVPMFKKSGLSIAMGQSSAEVQNEAHFVSESYEHDGFAVAIEKHFLSSTKVS